MHFLTSNKFVKAFLTRVMPRGEPEFPLLVMASIGSQPTVKSVTGENALLMPVSIATEWEMIKATIRTLMARLPTQHDLRDSLKKLHEQMEELQRHPGTFLYMRTFHQ